MQQLSQLVKALKANDLFETPVPALNVDHHSIPVSKGVVAAKT